MNCINVMQLILKMETEEQFFISNTTKFLLEKAKESNIILYENLNEMLNKNKDDNEQYIKILHLLNMFCMDVTFSRHVKMLNYTKNLNTQTTTLCKLNMYLDNINILLEKINQTMLCDLKFFSLRRFEQIGKDILLLNKEINKLNYTFTNLQHLQI